jgi:hypothetical protein
MPEGLPGGSPSFDQVLSSPAGIGSERAGERDGESVLGVGNRDVTEYDPHRRAALGLERRRQRQFELGLAVLHGEVARGGEGLLVLRLREVLPAIEAGRVGADLDVDLGLVPEAGHLPGDRERIAAAGDGRRADEVRATREAVGTKNSIAATAATSMVISRRMTYLFLQLVLPPDADGRRQT